MNERLPSFKKAVATAVSAALLLSSFPAGEALAQFTAAPVRSAPVAPVSGAAGGVSVVSFAPVQAGLSTVMLPGASAALPGSAVSVTVRPASALALPVAAPASAPPSVSVTAGAAQPLRVRGAVSGAAPVSAARPAASVEPVERPAKPRTVVGMLQGAARGLGRVLGLSGAGLKAGAGAPFEGTARLFGPVTVGARNGIDSPTPGGLVPYGPTPAQLGRFRDDIETSYPAGAMLTTKQILDMGARIGMSQAETWRAVTAMTEQGVLAAFSNARALVLNFDDTKQMLNDRDAKTARELAQEGLKLLEKDDYQDHARALALFDRAKRRLAESELDRSQTMGDMRMIELLRLNTYLETVRGLVADLERQLTTRADAERVRTTLAAVRAARDWLQGAMFDLHSDPKAPPVEIQSSLKAYTQALNAARFKDLANGADIVAGISLMQGLTIGLGRGELKAFGSGGGRSAPSSGGTAPKTPASVVPAGYPTVDHAGKPIIRPDDKNFANLFKYGTNLTAKVLDPKTSPLIGRKAELRQMVKTLLRVEKNNPVVIG
ncbi:MAG: hypothetical protein HYZ75_07335, partial [Elusimicrobia bacterium]|nr:hypothetical protein [Elusimicrobiota bacterium]